MSLKVAEESQITRIDTLRGDLDPFYQHEATTLNDPLRSVGSFHVQSEDDEGRITLETAIPSDGGNLGQCQILALAVRAIMSVAANF